MSANTVVQSMNIRRMYSLFADKSAPTKFAARQRYVEEVVVPPTVPCLLHDRATPETIKPAAAVRWKPTGRHPPAG